MREYFCDCCGRRLDRSEVRVIWNDGLDEMYYYCKYCGGECTDYEELEKDCGEEWGEDVEEDFDEED